MTTRRGAHLVSRGERAVDNALRTRVLEVFRPYREQAHAAIAPTRITGITLSLTVVGCVQNDPTHASVNVWMARTDGLVEETQLVQSVVRLLVGAS